MKGFGPKPKFIRRKRLEKTTEQAAIDFAKAEGVLSRKMNGASFRAWPDRAFMPPELESGKWEAAMPILWVEFKREGQDLTPAQADLHAVLRKAGQRVCTCHTLDEFKQHFCAYMSDDLGLEDYRL
jgi:hypothetical protein